MPVEIKISALDPAPVTPTGTEVLAVVQGTTTHKTTIDSLKPALVDNLSVGAPTWDVNGNLTADYDIIAGGNHDGEVALTINDGYGDANLTFNHTNGIPDVSGSSGRITCNVDSALAEMSFQLKGSVTVGSAPAMSTVLKLQDNNIQLLKATTCLTPTQDAHVARKDYVDDLLANKATTASVTAVTSSLTNHLSATTSHTKAQVGLSNVNNTSDANKPISTATQTALNGKIGEGEINTGDFTFANDTLSLNTILEGHIGELQISAGKIKNHAITANKLKGTESIAQGDFLIYDAATGGFETTASTSETHKLFSPNHTDVASNVTPSYGDSMYYNGTEWTTGNFGNYGADMEYVAVTLGTENLIKSGVNNSSGDVEYNVADFEGIGLQNSNIRGIYIYIYADFNGDDGATFSATMPDGVFTKIGQYDGDNGAGTQAGAHTVFVPINEGQESITIKQVINRQAHTLNWRWEIKGVQCTKRVALSPDLDIIHIVGSQDSAQKDQGYVDVDTNSFDTDTSVWSSENPTAVAAADWSGVFPITIPDNVSKTVIRLVNNWNYGGNGSEEVDNITITVDWNAGTINGIYTWNAEWSSTGFLYASDLVGEKQFTTEEPVMNSTPSIIKFQIIGRDIVKLPCPHHGIYHNTGQTYTIENYKTTAANIIDDIANDSSASSIATSQSVKEYVDKNTSTFQKFSDFQDRSCSSFYRTVSYINNSGKLCAVGYGGGYDMAGNGSDYLIAGSSPEIMVPLAAGESIINTFSNGVGAPTMYLLTDQNRVFSTGHNAQAQCGRGGTTHQRYFDRIPQLDGTTWISPNSGANNNGHMGAVRNGQLYMWGYNNQGQLGNGSATQANTPILINTGALAGKTITKVYTHTHYGYTFVVDSNRDVYATGYNVQGQLGLGSYTSRNTFAQVTGIKADDIILSHGSSAASTYIIDGTTLYSTGDNNKGQLGHGNLTTRNTFLAVPGVSAKTVSVGGHRDANVTCLQTDGTVKVWGHNNRGQLGLGNTTSRTSPVTLTAAGNNVVKAITHDNYGYTAILKTDGTIYTAGYNGHGACGVGDTTDRNTLTKIVMDNNIQFKDIALFGYNGGTQLIAIDQDNGMWGCGYNAQWSLGLNHTYTNITILAKLPIG